MEIDFKNFSLADCRGILEKKLSTKDFIEKSFKFCALNEKLGTLGEHCYLNISYEESGEKKSQRFFCKAASQKTESQRIFLDDQGCLMKECILFKDFIPDLLHNGINIINDCIPRCYFISDMKFLIFEDLSSLNYKVIDSRTSMNLECLKIGLDAIAKFHCSTFILEEKMTEKINTTYRIGEKYQILLKESFFPYTEPSLKLITSMQTGAKAVIDLLEKESNLNVELFKKLTDEAFDNFLEFVKPSTTFRNVMCHGDLWSSNLMYKFVDDKPVHNYIVDFQMQRYAPPAQDVMSFIYLVTDREIRQKHMEFLINYYYEKVGEILKDYNLSIDNILTYSEYIESCDYYKIFANCLAINHHHFTFIPPECTEYENNIHEFLFSDRSQYVLKLCAEDALFRKKSIENINELKQTFIDKGKL